MKEEKTKLGDMVLVSSKTECVPEGISMKEVPQGKVFDIRYYRDREWVLIFMDKKTFESLKALCDKRNLDIRKVLYGSLMKTKELLGGKDE
jgi:hypothetical protein